MNKNLFIVCPFSMVESFLQRNLGGDSLFLTAPGAILDLEDPFTVETIRNIASSNSLSSICVVNDSSCRFIDAAVEGRETPGLKAGRILSETFRMTGLDRMEGLSHAQLRVRLAENNVRRQSHMLETCPFLQPSLSDGGVRIKGMVTCWQNGLITNLNMGVRNRVLHEY
jgi:carbonic anhydrase